VYWRYKGDPSMWAWLLHRLTGVGIFVFLLLHIVDTALIGWGRDLYDAMMRLYHHPLFRIGEILLAGAVLFHGLNGLRVIILDFAPAATLYQRQLLTGVVVTFIVLFVPAAVIMFAQMLHATGSERMFQWGDWWREWRAWLPALGATSAIAAVSIPSLSVTRPQPSVRPVGGLELYGWLYLRVSGVLLLFLVLGHLVIMHLLDGGVNRVNYDFVAQRFAAPFWRTYDFVMLVLAIGHGIWGMRTVLLDYIHRPLPRLIALSTLYTITGIVAALGALVLFTFQPK